MSYPEKRNLIALLGTLFFAIFYTIYLWNLRSLGLLATTHSFSDWGYLVIGVLGLKIGFNIVVHIVFNIINTVATKEREPAYVDELDTLIELKSLMYAFMTFMLGFLGAIMSVAIGSEMLVMFNLFIYAFFAAEITGVASQFYYYKRGF
jgi:flagellar biosynthesis protein FlhB